MSLSNSKALIDTKTFRVNAVTTLIAIVTAVAGLDWVKENPNAAIAIAAITYFLQNVALRYVTETPVKSVMALLIAVGLLGCMAPDVNAAEPQRDQYGATIPADGYEVYNRVARDNRPGDLTEAEYRYLRDNMPRGDGLRGLTTRELEAIDPWYRENGDQQIKQLAGAGFLPPGVNESDPAVQAAVMRAAIAGAAKQGEYRTDAQKELDYWRNGLKAAQERQKQEARKAKKAAKKPANDKAASVDARSPFMTVGLLSNILGRIQRPSSCPGGNCGVQAAKPLPLPAKPLPSATKPVKPLAPMTNEQKRAAFEKAVREGRYSDVIGRTGDFTPGGNDFDGPVDYIPVAPKSGPVLVK